MGFACTLCAGWGLFRWPRRLISRTALVSSILVNRNRETRNKNTKGTEFSYPLNEKVPLENLKTPRMNYDRGEIITDCRQRIRRFLLLPVQLSRPQYFQHFSDRRRGYHVLSIAIR